MRWRKIKQHEGIANDRSWCFTMNRRKTPLTSLWVATWRRWRRCHENMWRKSSQKESRASTMAPKRRCIWPIQGTAEAKVSEAEGKKLDEHSCKRWDNVGSYGLKEEFSSNSERRKALRQSGGYTENSLISLRVERGLGVTARRPVSSLLQ